MTSLALTQALAEQHGVELRASEPTETEGPTAAQDDLPDFSGQDQPIEQPAGEGPPIDDVAVAGPEF